MEGIELVCFEIISNVGMARSCYIEAIEMAKDGNFDEYDRCIKEGEQFFYKGHEAHAKLIQKEANQENVQVSLLLTHAEDQLMSAEAFRILAEQFKEIYLRLSK